MKEKTALEYLSIAFDIAKDNYGILFLNYLIYSLILFLLIISYVGILAIPLIYAGYFIFVLGIKRKEDLSDSNWEHCSSKNSPTD